MSPCSEHDRVLARFLDGEPLPAAAAPNALDDHLTVCRSCQTALRQARRLDALLAQNATVDVTEAQADRWFAAVLPAAAPASARRWPVPVGAAAILVLGVAAGVLWQRAAESMPVPGPGPVRAPHPAAKSVHATALPHGDILPLPSSRRRTERRTVRRGVRRTPVTPQRLRDVARLHDRTLALRVAPGLAVGVALRTVLGIAPRWNGVAWQAAARDAATSARVRAGLRLLRSRRQSDRSAIEEFLATAADGTTLRRLLVHAQADPQFARRIRTRLNHHTPTSGLLRLAARLGEARLDHALVRLARKHPERTDSIALATTDLRVRPGRLELLFDLWALDHSTETQRQRWFRALPAASTAALIRTASTTRRGERRVRAIEALGWRADPSALTFLLGEVEGSHHECSRAAGHALSQLPRDAVSSRIVATLRGSRRPHVLVAALFGMRSPWPRGRIRTSDLTPEETEFLWAGAFSRQQFGIACRLCRGRAESAF